MRKLFRFIFSLKGWKVGPSLPPGIGQCVVVAAPHTSNWDLVYALGALDILGIRVKFTIKKEWMRFPLNLIFKPLGGVGIDRSPKVPGQAKKGMVETMAALYEKNPGLVLLVTPEGTRKKSEKWKTGFYHVATLANVPILLGYVDYKNKEAGIGKVIYPAKENFEKDMREIMAFYAEKQAKFPQSFSLDLEFADKK